MNYLFLEVWVWELIGRQGILMKWNCVKRIREIYTCYCCVQDRDDPTSISATYIDLSFVFNLVLWWDGYIWLGFSILQGAYTGVCSQQHVPSYKNNIDKFRAEKVDSVICVAVNDPYVMNAWAEKLQAKDAVSYPWVLSHCLQNIDLSMFWISVCLSSLPGLHSHSLNLIWNGFMQLSS